MRFREIITEVKPVKPMTPTQARARAERISKAQASIQDVVAANTLRIEKARKRLTDL